MRSFLFSIAGFLLLVPGMSSSTTADGTLPSGLEIVRQVNARDDGHQVGRRVLMELIDKKGKTRARRTFGYRKYYGEEKRSVLFFESPQNVKGTGFLTFDYLDEGRDDNQWLYLPALRKVRRISSSDRGGYFLGTDFSYEDMKKETKFAIEDYHHKTTGTEEVDGHRCYIVEHVPVNEEIARELGYGRVVSYIDPGIWIARKAEFWDVQLRPLKTIHTREIRAVDGVWTSYRLEAENHKTGHKTILTLIEVDYGTPVADDVFTERALRRGP
jgi:hypothetical protein